MEMSHIIGKPLSKARGRNVAIFYFSNLGCYLWCTSEEVPVTSGMPQNLQTHLEKDICDINYCTAAKDFRGLDVTDCKYWRLQRACNWDVKDLYRRKSRKLIIKMEGNIANDVEHLFRVSFKERKAFMKETKRDQRALWGHYLPCHNYSFPDQDYTNSCQSEILRNNELSWLWDSSAALHPSTSIKKSLGNSRTLHFSQFRVNESIRTSSMTSQDYALTLFIYTQLGYRDEPLLFLSMQDLNNSIGESTLGAAGTVIWQDMNLTSSKSNCTKVQKFIDSELGSCSINVTSAAELHSKHLCRQDNGCVQKSWRASIYLHLWIDALEDQRFIVRVEASNEDLETMAETFVCHCYQGYECTNSGQVTVADDDPGSSADSVPPRRLAVICLHHSSLIGLF
ncbi:LOW QUALITY PROTEIN: hyaluronidase-4 [Porphyrio hochstetteri]